ncbi:hypothetical protein MLD38_030357 [Melastoma candidum]|uniref:Uncharacterized protein n=1 Tax=Melastoma candidum TaxID=119954 RepID=A0ACB9MM06_9MYRT|nr:hypothetical protein MLD38_030357 [Melastoma candidum]
MGTEHQSTFDPYAFLEISPNLDGTITRHTTIPVIPASLDPDPKNASLSRDVPLDPDRATWIRLYLPNRSQPSDHPRKKLPLIVYFHGGGFVILSAATSINHYFSSLLAAELDAVVASVEYRLAPEHRLPAAYDDAMDSLRWLDSSDDEWIREYADLSQCYLMGSSAGSNMAYHVGLRASAGNGKDHARLRIKGLILHHPFFGGSKRTASEVRLSDTGTLPMTAIDLMWELALPAGVGFNHEYCNPTAGDISEGFKRIRSKGWRVMVTGGGEDPMVDRQKELAEKLTESGVEVVASFVEEDSHCIELFHGIKAAAFIKKIKSFMCN